MPASGTYVFDSDRRVLLVRHAESGYWTNPGGMVEPFETPADAAVRETWEETGFLVEPRSPDQVAIALMRLLGDSVLAKHMGRAAREHVENHFNLDVMVRGYEALFIRLLRKKSKRQTPGPALAGMD